MTFLASALVKAALFQIPGVRLILNIVGVLIVGYVLLYVLLAMALSAMMKRQMLRGAFLAWVPIIGQGYVLGLLADQVSGNHLYRIALTCLPCAAAALGIVMLFQDPVAGWLVWIGVGLGVTFCVFWFKALYWVYAQYTKAPTTFLVLSIVFFFLGPIILFLCRKTAPKVLNARELR